MDRSHELIQALLSVIPESRRPCYLHEPTFGGNELAYLTECIETGWVSSVGSFVDGFEERLAAYTGAKFAVVTVNGTAALHAALHLTGVSRDDEVLVPALTFIATANAVAYCGAVPHFVDSEPVTLGVDPPKLARYLEDIALLKGEACFNRHTGRRIRALVPMHTFGHPSDLDALAAICETFRITLVEDAAESLGSYYRGRHTGNHGVFAALSFNGNKIITTGGGGALLTNDPELARRAKHVTTTAKQPHRWAFNHDTLGFNYRMPNLNAAVGCAQLEQLEHKRAAKRHVAARYAGALAAVEGVDFVKEPPHSESNYWLNNLLLPADGSLPRDEVLESMHAAGIMARPAWSLMVTQPMYAAAPRMDLSGAEDLERRLISLPSSPFLAGAAE